MQNLVYKFKNPNLKFPEGKFIKYIGEVKEFHYISCDSEVELNKEFELVEIENISQEISQSTKFSDIEKYKLGIISLDPIKKSKISEIKQESGNLINNKYPPYKQFNIMRDEAKTSIKYKEMQEFINNVRIKSDELETKINEMIDIEELSNFNLKNEFVL